MNRGIKIIRKSLRSPALILALAGIPVQLRMVALDVSHIGLNPTGSYSGVSEKVGKTVVATDALGKVEQSKVLHEDVTDLLKVFVVHPSAAREERIAFEVMYVVVAQKQSHLFGISLFQFNDVVQPLQCILPGDHILRIRIQVVTQEYDRGIFDILHGVPPEGASVDIWYDCEFHLYISKLKGLNATL